MNAFIFPGQGSQHTEMGKTLYEQSSDAQAIFKRADQILGFKLSEIMFEGSSDDLKQTKVTQPAIFTHSIALLSTLNTKPKGVAGHSLGEFSALVAAEYLSFEDGLALVHTRAKAMQNACETHPSTMAAILGLESSIIDQVCKATEGIVVLANDNCPGQIVISGEHNAIDTALETLKEKGAKRAIKLPVGGAFHSPLMQGAKQELQDHLERIEFKKGFCPIYQNIDGAASSDPAMIKQKLTAQLTGAVLWTLTVHSMIAQGFTEFYEIGPGKVLQGLIRKISRETTTGNSDDLQRK